MRNYAPKSNELLNIRDSENYIIYAFFFHSRFISQRKTSAPWIIHEKYLHNFREHRIKIRKRRNVFSNQFGELQFAQKLYFIDTQWQFILLNCKLAWLFAFRSPVIFFFFSGKTATRLRKFVENCEQNRGRWKRYEIIVVS